MKSSPSASASAPAALAGCSTAVCLSSESSKSSMHCGALRATHRGDLTSQLNTLPSPVLLVDRLIVVIVTSLPGECCRISSNELIPSLSAATQLAHYFRHRIMITCRSSSSSSRTYRLTWHKLQ